MTRIQLPILKKENNPTSIRVIIILQIFFEKNKKDYSKYQCYNYHKIGHLSREFPSPKKNNNKKRNHAHLDEDEDEERPQKKTRGEDVEEYVLFPTLSGSVTPREGTWLIDSGASKHMRGKKTTLSKIEEKNSPQKVSLGDDYQYPIKGIGQSSYKLESGTSMKMKKYCMYQV